MSTMLPEEMDGGRRIEGNSIWWRKKRLVFEVGRLEQVVGIAHKPFVLCKKYSDAGVDFADCKRDQHCVITFVFVGS